MISAVIVNHNSFNFLNPLINSLKKEGVEEIILVDNSLSLEERKKLENLKGVFLYFLQENKGLGNAFNFGAKVAKGEFLLFCNPDLLFKENSIIKLKEEIRNFDALGPSIFWDIKEEFFLPYPYPFNLFSEILRIFSPSLSTKNYLSYEFKIWYGEKIVNLPLLSGTCFLIKKSVFDELNGFDENFFLYFEENDFFLRFKKKGFKCGFLPSSKVIHFYKLSKEEKHKEFFENSKNLYKKKYFPKIFTSLLNFQEKSKKEKIQKIKELEKEKIENLDLIISPYYNFIPSVFIKNSKNWDCLKEKLIKLSFEEGYIGILKNKKILKSYHFKVK